MWIPGDFICNVGRAVRPSLWWESKRGAGGLDRYRVVLQYPPPVFFFLQSGFWADDKEPAAVSRYRGGPLAYTLPRPVSLFYRPIFGERKKSLPLSLGRASDIAGGGWRIHYPVRYLFLYRPIFGERKKSLQLSLGRDSDTAGGGWRG